MKILTYKVMGYTGVYNPETEEVEQKEFPATVVVECPTKAAYDASYPIAEDNAIPGTIAVSGEFDPEPEPIPSEESVWDELDEAYQKGVDSV